MELSRVLRDVVELERSIAELYTKAATYAGDPEVADMLRLLAKESRLHAGKIESEISDESGISELLSSLEDRIGALKKSKDSFEVLQAGIEMERKLEELYRGIAETLEFEEEIAALGEHEGEGEEEEASRVLKEIAADERRHQRFLMEIYRNFKQE